MATEQKAKAYTCITESISTKLKENKDERIRKEIIEMVRNWASVHYITKEQFSERMAWLEKQAEPIEINPTEFDTRLQDLIGKFGGLPKEELIGSLRFWMNSIENNETYNDEENQNGQEEPQVYMTKDNEVITYSENDGYKVVEPNFKVGDWITDGYLHCKISVVLDDRYIVDTKFSKRSAILFKLENNYHLWTIQDAKKGDVLSSKDGRNILIFRNLDTNTSFSSYYNISGRGEIGWSNNSFIPATKEQRDILFAKMHKAGYEWDIDKKELKKIDSNSVWSEEDEKKFSDTLAILRGGENCYYNSPILIDWLKSLKERIGE